MQNHAHNVQVVSSEPLPASDLFSRFQLTSSTPSRVSRKGLDIEVSVGTVGVWRNSRRKAVQSVSFPETPARVSFHPRERVALQQDWHFHPGDPSDAHHLFIDSRHRMQPIAGNFLSPLEDDAAPTRRNSPGETTLGGDISWAQPEFVDSDWAVVGLSGVRENVDRVGWYRHSFDSPATDQGLHIALEMTGGFGQSLIWLNGHCLGSSAVGSAGLRRDLTPHIIVGGKNTLVLRVEDRTAAGEFAGIARSVSLVKKDPLHLGHVGSAVTGNLQSSDRATLSVGTVLHNEQANARRGTLCGTLLDPAGRALAEAKCSFHIFGQDRSLLQLKLTVDDASWLAENPGEYLMRTRIVLNDQIVDEEISPFDLKAALSTNHEGEFFSTVC
jgi:beta-galactosidase